jgi:chromosome transmission fidelity protein 4
LDTVLQLTTSSTIFTGGNDQLVRQHDAEDLDSEPNFVDQNDSVTSIAASNEYLVTASVDNIVRRFVGTEPDGFVTRASGVPVRWVSFDKAGERLAVCSE